MALNNSFYSGSGRRSSGVWGGMAPWNLASGGTVNHWRFMFCASMPAYCEPGINTFGDDQADIGELLTTLSTRARIDRGKPHLQSASGVTKRRTRRPSERENSMNA